MQKEVLDKNIKTSRSGAWIYAAYLCGLCSMFFLRDVLLLPIPMLVFLGYLALGLIASDYDHFLALMAVMPLLDHGVQASYLVFAAMVVYIIKYGRGMTLKMPLAVVSLLMVYELIHVTFAGDSYSAYFKYLAHYGFLGIVLGESRMGKLLKNPIVVLKTFVVMAMYFMLDVFLVTLQYLPFESLVFGESRFGMLTDFIGDRRSLGDNQNMVAMFALVAISIVIVCMFYEKKNYILYSFALLYLSFFGLLTASKTFLICLLALAALALLFLFRKSILKAVAVMSVGIVTVVVLSNTLFAEAFENTMARFSGDNVFSSRFLIFGKYHDFIFSDVRNILFGTGLQNVHSKANIVNSPHNAIQEVLLCWGIIGLILMGLLCWQLIKQYRRSKNDEKFAYIIPLIMFAAFIQTIQFVRLTSIFGMLVLLYISILCADVKREEDGEGDVANKEREKYGV